MNVLYLAWRDSESRRWYPVGRLMTQNGVYRFEYTHGAREAHRNAGFTPLSSFPNFEQSYTSERLFPLFSNRLLSSSRPEYPDFLEWLSVSADERDPIALLARGGGQRQTDTFEVFPHPQITNDGEYVTHFFVRGIRYMPPHAIRRAEQLSVGELLVPMRDVQNPADAQAILLRTHETPYDIIGFCPRYLAEDVSALLDKTPSHLEITTVRINPAPAPVQYRVLCRLVAREVGEFVPLSGAEYQPILESEK